MKGTSLSVEETIRLEAYLLSEKAGHPPDMDAMFWAQAEQIVQGRIAAVAPSGVTKFVKVPKAPATTSKPKAKAAGKKTAKTAAPARKDAQLLLAPEVPATVAPAKPAKAKAGSATTPKKGAPKTPAKRDPKKA